MWIRSISRNLLHTRFIRMSSTTATAPKVDKKSVAAVFPKIYPEGFPYEYIDSHCHIDAILGRLSGKSTSTGEAYTYDTLRAEYPGNWSKCLTVCCEPDSYDAVMSLLDNDTSNTLVAAFGVHPHEASKWTAEVQAKFESAMSHPKVIAWGECGLDYHYDMSPRDIQKEVFITQMLLAVKYNKPLVVHTREAEEDTVELMQKYLPKDWKVHIHCCTSSRKMVLPLLDYFPNLKVGFTGCITFKTADDIRDTFSVVPVERLLVETDAPYMSPLPFRGQVCHSGMIPFILSKFAEEKNLPLETVAHIIRENTREVYGI